jgi:putative flippase GtrA
MNFINKIRCYGSKRSFRFFINGLIATAANYLVLFFLVEYVSNIKIAVASLISSFVGITTSFIGNRIFVFKSKSPVLIELVRFKVIYATTALFQALCMTLWVDVLFFNYTIGFLLVTLISVFLSYLSNKTFVFK